MNIRSFSKITQKINPRMKDTHSRIFFTINFIFQKLMGYANTITYWIYHSILPVLYPRHCPLCCRILPYGTMICRHCEIQLPFIHEPTCYSCGKPITSSEQEYCYDCRTFRKSFCSGIALFLYNEQIHPSMMAFKYGNHRMLSQFFAREIYIHYRNILHQWKLDAIIPIPIHKDKRKKRGYNQAALLAKELSTLLNLPCYPDLLIRTVNTLPQKQLTPRARLNNLQNAFGTNVKYQDTISALSSVLLVDDIYTTGSTMEVCSRLLLSRGVQKVYICSVCIGVSRD